MQDIVAQISTAAFALDQNLRLVAWNQSASDGWGLDGAAVLGKACFDVLGAIDPLTERDCIETCPQLDETRMRGWSYCRDIRVRFKDGSSRLLRCFVLACRKPGGQPVSLYLIEPGDSETLRRYSGIISLLDAMQAAVMRAWLPQQALAWALRALLDSAGADVASLLISTHPPEGMVLTAPAFDPGESARDTKAALERAMHDCIDSWGMITPSLPLPPQVRRAKAGDDRQATEPHPMVSTKAPVCLVERSSSSAPWILCLPLIAQEEAVGVVGLAASQPDFDLALAARLLLPMGLHLGSEVDRALASRHSRPQPILPPQIETYAPLRIHCLGTLRLIKDGTAMSTGTIHRRKARKALQYLALHRDRVVSRKELAQLLWPNCDASLALPNLRVVLHDLRRGLDSNPPFLQCEGDGVRLDPSPRVWVDVEAFWSGSRHFLTLVEEGQVAEAMAIGTRIIALYSGDLLEEEPKSDWCASERASLHGIYLGLIKQLVGLLIGAGETAKALSLCHRGLAIYPGCQELMDCQSRLHQTGV